MSDLHATASHGAHEPPAATDSAVRLQLAMLHGARDRGDRAEAARAWEWILAAEMERVRGIARGHRSSTLPNGRIPESDIDDVAHEVFMQLHDKIDNLRGRSVGELRAFLRKATDYRCLDYVRDHVRDDRRRAGSIDAPSDSGAPTATDRALADLAQQMSAEGEAADVMREMLHQGLGFVDDDKRAVLVMDAQGHSVAEIMERLGITRDNVYQRRKRALKQLRDAILELAEEDDGR